MICSSCGRETRPGSTFCTNCGRPVPPTFPPQPPVAQPPPVTTHPPAPWRRFPWALAAAGVAVAAAVGVTVAQTRSSPEPGATPVAPTPTARVVVVTAGPPTPRQPECSTAAHPPQGSVERKRILDALRAHYRYDGVYQVQFVTVVRDWAYLEAAPFDQRRNEVGGEFRGFLTRFVGGRWAWRWEGGTGAEAAGGGSPPYPSEFDDAARDVLRC